jgi:hypothetical protein
MISRKRNVTEDEICEDLEDVWLRLYYDDYAHEARRCLPC